MESEAIMKDIKKRYDGIKKRAKASAINSGRNPDDVKIIAVSKTHPVKELECAYKAGLRCFGENYVQELTDKNDIFHDKGISGFEWHFIGHLQTNKVRFIAPFVHFIHSVDSFKLADEISKRAIQNERNINILLQINTSGESSKSGCEPDDAIQLIEKILELKNINVIGLMTIGTFTDDETIQRREFSLLRNTLIEVNSQLGTNLKELSMGMTGDFEVAINEGATMVRVGTAIFGDRIYKNFG